jgi:hypothetical protein
MQGRACCVLFELFAFNEWVLRIQRSFTLCFIRDGQAGQNPNPSQTEGFGTPHGSRELRLALVV